MTPDELHGMLLMAAVEGCCANDKWHGRLCTFHSGYGDGLEAGLEAYAKLLDAAHIDETVRPTSWTVCPFCHAGAHRPCATKSGRTYPMGSYHLARIQKWERQGPRTPPARIDGDG